MEHVSLDTFKEIINLLSLEQVRRLCQTNVNIATLCRNAKVEELIATNWIKKFSKPQAALVAASRDGKLDELNSLLILGIDPTYNYNQALEMALLNNRTKIVQRSHRVL